MTRQKLDQYDFYARLQKAHRNKARKQVDIEHVLPPDDVDFAEYFENIIPKDLPEPPDNKRYHMSQHWQNLRYGARGQPEAVALHMLLISYLRRDTQYTKRAWSLFNRLWEEYVGELIENIPPRDIVSAFRTFADHEPNRERKLLAKLCFTYAHMMKLYESERFHEGLSLKELGFELPQKCPDIGIQHLWGVRYGGDNSFEIMHLELVEEVMEDEVLGPLLLYFMWRVQSGDSIFSRFDQARIKADLELESPRQWSFGFNPNTPLDEG